MMEFLQVFVDGVTGNIIGGVNTDAVTMASLFLITILAAILLAARFELEMALIIVSPAVIIASFAGMLPPLAFGVMVLLLGVFFAGIIIAMIR